MRTYTLLTLSAALLLPAAMIPPTAYAHDPKPPAKPTDIGGCCYGPAGADATSTRADCADPAQSPTGKPGIFVKGIFPDTDDDNKFCDMIPGGD